MASEMSVLANSAATARLGRHLRSKALKLTTSNTQIKPAATRAQHPSPPPGDRAGMGGLGNSLRTTSLSNVAIRSDGALPSDMIESRQLNHSMGRDCVFRYFGFAAVKVRKRLRRRRYLSI